MSLTALLELLDQACGGETHEHQRSARHDVSLFMQRDADGEIAARLWWSYAPGDYGDDRHHDIIRHLTSAACRDEAATSATLAIDGGRRLCPAATLPSAIGAPRGRDSCNFRLDLRSGMRRSCANHHRM